MVVAEAAAGREEAGRTTTMQIHIDKERPGGTAREEPGGGARKVKREEQHTTRGGGGEAYPYSSLAMAKAAVVLPVPGGP